MARWLVGLRHSTVLSSYSSKLRTLKFSLIRQRTVDQTPSRTSSGSRQGFLCSVTDYGTGSEPPFQPSSPHRPLVIDYAKPLSNLTLFIRVPTI